MVVLIVIMFVGDEVLYIVIDLTKISKTDKNK